MKLKYYQPSKDYFYFKDEMNRFHGLSYFSGDRAYVIYNQPIGYRSKTKFKRFIIQYHI